MKELVKKLRESANEQSVDTDTSLFDEAADEIEFIYDELKELKEKIKDLYDFM